MDNKQKQYIKTGSLATQIKRKYHLINGIMDVLKLGLEKVILNFNIE